MSDKGKPTIKLRDGQKDDDQNLFLVTIKTDFEIIKKSVVTNKEQSNENIVNIEPRTVKLSELETLGVETRKFNQRQEYYIKQDHSLMRAGKGQCKFMYISSKDPSENKNSTE